MLILVIGGSGSGKSEYAEARCMQLAPGRKLYIATMEPVDAESRARIARHRENRAGKGFETLECQTHLEEAQVPEGTMALLECMSNLVANEMFSASGRGARLFFEQEAFALEKKKLTSTEGDFESALTDLVMRGVRRLCHHTEHTVIVTNQVFSDGITYDADTERYLRVLAKMNAEIAAFADEVVEIVHGVPIVLK